MPCTVSARQWEPATKRERILTLGVAPADQVGIEVGAANNPIIPPYIGACRYVDYMTTAALRERLSTYAGRDSLVEVDYVWSGTGWLVDQVGEQRFDYAIASHVLEHVPNPLGWFAGVYEALRPGANLNLALPDRRFTFDFAVPQSTLGQLVEAYLLKYERPSARQVFDNCFYGKAIEPTDRWQEGHDAAAIGPYVGSIAPQLSLEQARRAVTGVYFDSHCWIFTPDSFLDLMDGACTIGLMPFEFVDFHTTMEDEFEFLVNLRRPNDTPSPGVLLERQRSRIYYFKKALAERRRRLQMLVD